MNTSLRFFFLVVFAIAIFFVVFDRKEISLYMPLSYSESALLAEVPLLLAVADTDEERREGLSGQKPLEPNQGLLFLFGTTDRHGIWMKDMLFAIDVLWLSEDKKVIDIRERFSPESFPEIAYPTEVAAFVLELPAGFVAEHEIRMGDSLVFPIRETS